MRKKVVVIYSASARKDLQKLDKAIAKKVVLKIDDNSKQNNILSRAKSLQGVLGGLYRYRVGDYRVVFEIEDNKIIVLIVLRIKHRKEVYKK